jgi:outer membrane protein assembly factor BamB
MRQSLILKTMALKSLIPLGLGLVATFGSTVADDSWPQWRGPNRDGFAAPQSLLSKWPEAGPAVAWAYEDTGAGYSSVSVEDGKVYTLGKLDGQATAICLDSKTGKKLWQTPFGDGKASYNTGWGDGPRGTPTIDGDFIFCVSDMGTVACLNKETVRWFGPREFVKEFGGGVPVWGYSESPLIDGDRVVVTPGNKSFLVGLNKNTGETTWQSKPNYEAQYVSVIKAEFEGIPVYLSATKPGLGRQYTLKRAKNYSFILKQETTLPSFPRQWSLETSSIIPRIRRRMCRSRGNCVWWQAIGKGTLPQQQR